MNRFGFISGDFVYAAGRLYPGGCGYYRCMLPMNAAGPGAKFGPPAWTADRGFGVRLNRDYAHFGFDTIVIKQLMERWMPFQMRQAKQLGQRLIVDVDDAYDFLHDENQAKRSTDPMLNKIANRDHMRDVIMEADIVTVSTPFLLEYYSGLRGNVVMVRNGISPKQFPKRKVTRDKPTIGWTGALRWRSSDLDVFRGWLGDFLVAHDLMFVHAGHEENQVSFAKLADVPEERVVTTPMRSIAEYHLMLDFDIGVVPLTNIPFNEAKSYLKGIEYAASNIPFVASDLPEYRYLSEEGGVGRVADTPEEWQEHLTALLDFETRKKEAGVQRSRVMKHQSIVARAPEWVNVFEGSPSTSIATKIVEYRQV